MSKPVIRILGIPMDLGQRRRGVDMGPSAIRYAGLQERLDRLGYETHDCGNVTVLQAEQMEQPAGGKTAQGQAHLLPEVAAVCRQIADRVQECVQPADRVIFLGGDHSLSIGTVAAMAAGRRIGVIWVDAHGDLNTPLTSPSGNIHGMPVAALLGDGPPELVDVGFKGPKLEPSRLALIGLRDLDPAERERLARSDIMAYTMRAIDEQGIAAPAGRILDHLSVCEHLHVSLDMDSLDPSAAPGVGTPVPGGLSYREAHLLMEILADSGRVRSMDIVEVNPILDSANRTAEMAVDLAGSLFGKRIL